MLNKILLIMTKFSKINIFILVIVDLKKKKLLLLLLYKKSNIFLPFKIYYSYYYISYRQLANGASLKLNARDGVERVEYSRPHLLAGQDSTPAKWEYVCVM